MSREALTILSGKGSYTKQEVVPTLEPTREKEKRRKLAVIKRKITEFMIGLLAVQSLACGTMARQNKEGTGVKTGIELSVDERMNNLNKDKEARAQEFVEQNQDKYELLQRLKNKEDQIKKNIGPFGPWETLYLESFLRGEKFYYTYGEPLSKEKFGEFESRKDHVLKNIFGEKQASGQAVEISMDSDMELTPIKVEGGNLESEDVSEYLGTIPLNWVNGEISSIKQIEKGDPPEERGGSIWTVLGKFKDDKLGSKKGHIILTEALKEKNVPEVLNIINHELGHANDWGSDNDTFYEEKLDLLLGILARIDSPDRYMSSYVESYKDGDDKTIHFRKFRMAQEYWAEISGQYFSDPTQLSIIDLEIVDSWIRKGDPGYNWKLAFEAREKIVMQITPPLPSRPVVGTNNVVTQNIR